MIARIKEGNLWDYLDNNQVIGITTNGSVKKDGCAVLGIGIAKQAKERFPQLPRLLGEHLTKNGNVPGVFEMEDVWGTLGTVVSVPVKKDWFDDASIDIIKQSLRTIRQMPFESVYMPKPGVLNGRLEWNLVRQQITPIITNSNIYIVDIA